MYEFRLWVFRNRPRLCAGCWKLLLPWRPMHRWAGKVTCGSFECSERVWGLVGNRRFTEQMRATLPRPPLVTIPPDRKQGRPRIQELAERIDDAQNG